MSLRRRVCRWGNTAFASRANGRQGMFRSLRNVARRGQSISKNRSAFLLYKIFQIWAFRFFFRTFLCLSPLFFFFFFFFRSFFFLLYYFFFFFFFFLFFFYRDNFFYFFRLRSIRYCRREA